MLDISSLSNNRNLILASLSQRDAELLQPHLKPVNFKVCHSMEKPHTPIESVYFPETGIASIVAIGDHGRRIETGIFGRDGMSGSAIVMGWDSSPHEIYVQCAGAGQSIASDLLREAMDRSASLRNHFLRYIQFMMIQTAHTALANGRAKLEERLARWLLMYHDRLEGDELLLTHDFLALMLGVRRAGVTVAIHLLEGRGLIKASRGTIIVVDREGLVEKANGSYGVPEAEYKRLMGQVTVQSE